MHWIILSARAFTLSNSGYSIRGFQSSPEKAYSYSRVQYSRNLSSINLELHRADPHTLDPLKTISCSTMWQEVFRAMFGIYFAHSIYSCVGTAKSERLPLIAYYSGVVFSPSVSRIPHNNLRSRFVRILSSRRAHAISVITRIRMS